MLTQRCIPRLLQIGVFLLLAVLGACRDSPFGPRIRGEMAVLGISANVAGTPISTLVVEVTAADLSTPLVFNLEIVEGLASGTLKVPPGAARTFRALAYQSSGEITHEGSSTVDVKAGTNPPIHIVLVARSGGEPIIITLADHSVEVTPAEARLDLGDTLRLRATIRDAHGRVISGEVEWATLNAALATVSREGLVTAQDAGEVQIVASYAGVAGSARLTIGETTSAGGQIAFVRFHDSSGEIYVINADGSNEANLTNHPAEDWEAVWSPDGSRIGFTSNRDGNREVYVMHADGSNLQRLTNDPAEDGGAVWSPDGTRIAFTSSRDGNSEIYVMHADGSDLQRLTNNQAWDGFLAWSPDGSRIAFSCNFQICVMNADGSNVRRLTAHLSYTDMVGTSGATGPAWSPDGSRIVFQSSRQLDEGGAHIYVMDADGSNQVKLTTWQTLNSWWNTQPVWSPDGSRIAFSCVPQICVMNADGSDVRRLTDHVAERGAMYPAWSPDGSRIAFSSDREGNGQIYVMNADGSNARRLTNQVRWDAYPVWRP